MINVKKNHQYLKKQKIVKPEKQNKIITTCSYFVRKKNFFK